MARLPRKLLKIFAGDATNNGVFGSAQDNTKVLSNDLDVIQSKAAWGLGWLQATVGARKFPPLEEMQSTMFVAMSQIAYILQEGIGEYDSSTTYYQKSMVKQPGTYRIYGSVSDGNVGHPLTDSINWVFLQDLSLTVQQATISQYGTVQLATESDLTTGNTSTDVMTAALGASHGFVTGNGKEHWLSDLQSGWVWADGKTIGNASSNATNRANADTQALFTGLWNEGDYNYSAPTANSTQGQLQVYTSTGVAVAKGASAAADFAANRTIQVIDKRSRVSAGKDNMGGTAAGRLSGQANGVNGQKLGAVGGVESHSLVAAENGPHSHNTDGIYSNLIGGGSGTVGGNRSNSASVQSSLSGDGAPHNNVQPTIVCNYIIKL